MADRHGDGRLTTLARRRALFDTLTMGAFLIVGLPRSRTAWLAVATGALHEPRHHDIPWEGGISDSRLSAQLPQIFAAFEPRTLIVERSPSDVMLSFKNYVGNMRCDWKAVELLLRRYLNGLDFQHPQIKRVRFEQLDNINTVRASLDWLGVPEPANLSQLMHMNIQSDLAFNLARMKEAT